jgi:hypothetical protein
MLESQPMTNPLIEAPETAFAITVNFVKGQGDPSRPFRTMVNLVEALARFDRDLVKSVDVTIEPVLLLENVEAGSIKSWFISLLRSTDDAALRSGEWKRVVGEYTVKGKYALLKSLDKATSVTDPQLLESVQSELFLQAEQTNARNLLGYAPMSRTRLAAHIADVTASLEYLSEGDSATYESRNDGPVPFNRSLRINDAEMAELLAIRTVTNNNELILKVKKPDYLGSSMWEFHFDGRTIEAKIQDSEWLAKFHDDGAGLRPGGALRANVCVEVSYDEQNESLPPKYTVLKVFEVIPPPPHQEQLLLQ